MFLMFKRNYVKPVKDETRSRFGDINRSVDDPLARKKPLISKRFNDVNNSVITRNHGNLLNSSVSKGRIPTNKTFSKEEDNPYDDSQRLRGVKNKKDP